MRIRKRFPPPSVTLSSDPQLITPSPPLVQLHFPTLSQPSDPPNQPHPNQQIMIPSEKPRWVHHQRKELDGEEAKEERWTEEEKNNQIIRKSSNLGQDSSTHQILPPGSHQVVERWYEGDHKVVPLKKRIVREETRTTTDKKVKGKMKSKTNKKCTKLYGEEQEEEDSEGSKSKSGSNSKKGSEIMEGSRCSRVNGRGWRCGQQTLVGYSLCEHHLGKGRLRSMASVRGQALGDTRVAPKKPVHVPVPVPVPALATESETKTEPELLLDEIYDDDEDDGDGDGGGALMVRKKRTRLGVVKARSLKELIGANR